MKPGPIRCYGACGGVPGVKLPPFGTYCTLCQGAGELKYPASWADEYEAVKKARDAAWAMRGRRRPEKPAPRLTGQRPRKPRAKKKAPAPQVPMPIRRVVWTAAEHEAAKKEIAHVKRTQVAHR